MNLNTAKLLTAAGVALGLMTAPQPVRAETPPAQVSVIHGIPGLPAPVDVYANGGYVLTFDFPNIEGPLMLPAGTYYLEVKLQGSTVLDTTATVASGGNYTVIAHLLEGSGIDLAVFENDASPARRGAPRVTVRHAADAPAVDVGLKPWRSRKSLGPFGPAQNGEELGPLNVRPGRYTAEVFAAGTTDLVAALPVSLRPFTGYIVYAVGSLEDGTFQFLVQQQELPRH
jgi:hypothetical protein